MKTIKASEFKAKCLSLMDDVAQSGEEIIGMEGVRRCQQPIALMWIGIDFVSQGSQFLDARPNRRAADSGTCR